MSKPSILDYEVFINDVDQWVLATADLENRWKDMDPLKEHTCTGRWREYRLRDCFEICTQEAERIRDIVHAVPRSALESRTSLAELEQQFGLWKPYLSDSDDEDYDEEETSSSSSQNESEELDIDYGSLRPGDEDFPYSSMSDDNISVL